MKQAEYEQHVRIAMTIFLSFAAVIFLSALAYSFITGNSFAEAVLLSAGIVITGIIYYTHKKITT
jgi:hypothetical protein